MFTRTNLHLLHDELITLSRTPYFNKSLENYLNNLIEAIRITISEYENLPPDVTSEITNAIWVATKYLHGGTSKTIPYETVYALRLALKDWVSEKCAITTALQNDLDYHFCTVAPGQVITKFLNQVTFDTELIQIALPKLYRHRPIYNVALYHELGHFVDIRSQITALSLIQHPAPQESHSHRAEYFADLFAASYTGYAISHFLNAVAKDAPESPSHPSTRDRIESIDKFLKGDTTSRLQVFQNVLLSMGLPDLSIRYISPDIKSSFRNVRTYKISDTKEIHGILDSGWTMLLDPDEKTQEPWSSLDKEEFGRIINDLIEKSIRNKMISTNWNNANT